MLTFIILRSIHVHEISPNLAAQMRLSSKVKTITNVTNKTFAKNVRFHVKILQTTFPRE